MPKKNVKCRECSGPALFLGTLCGSKFFAGKKLSDKIPESNLYRCLNCEFVFKFPVMDPDYYNELYSNGSSTTWSAEPLTIREDFSLAIQFLEKNFKQGARILDVGCFDGAFLRNLVDQYDCFGVEINSSAARKAQKHGIQIISNDLANISGSYDFITMFDVIEHVDSPMHVINSCISSLKSGGFIILSTGNWDSLSFNIMKEKYYYAQYPEHISFIGMKYLTKICQRMGLEIVHIDYFSRAGGGIFTKIRQMITNLLYILSPNIYTRTRAITRNLLGKPLAEYNSDGAPSLGSARDHFLVALKVIK